MKLYNALVKKNQNNKIEDIVLIKEGTCLTAFFFNGLWFLYHKMWREFFALILVDVALSLFLDIDKIILQISFSAIVALNANYWLMDHLKKKGYEFVGSVFGGDVENAKLRFIRNFEGDINNDVTEFDDSILNPKLHRKIMKLKKSQKHSPA